MRSDLMIMWREALLRGPARLQACIVGGPGPLEVARSGWMDHLRLSFSRNSQQRGNYVYSYHWGDVQAVVGHFSRQFWVKGRMQ